MKDYKKYICKKCRNNFRSKSKSPYCHKCLSTELELGGKGK